MYRGLSVSVFVTRRCPAKTAEAIEMPSFGWLTQTGSRNHVLDEAEIPHKKMTVNVIFRFHKVV